MVSNSWLIMLAMLGGWAVWSDHGPLTLAVGLSALIPLSLVAWRRFSLSGVTYRRRLSATRATFGESVELTAELLNAKPLPLTWLKVSDSLPLGLPVEAETVRGDSVALSDSLVFAVAMLPYERIARRLRVRCMRRGRHMFGSASLESGDYLGALRSYDKMRETDYLLVLPKIQTLALGRLASDQIIGRDAARRNHLTDPIRSIGTRDYAAGDAYKTIDWRATARLGALAVRVFEPSTSPMLDIVLDLSPPPLADPADGADRVEFAISVAASLANYASQHHWPVGLRANARSSGAQIELPISATPGQVRGILETLAYADVSAICTLPSLLAAPRPRSAHGATLVVITTALNPAALAAALELRPGSRAVTVFHITNDTTLAAEWPVIRVPYDSDWTERDSLVLGA